MSTARLLGATALPVLVAALAACTSAPADQPRTQPAARPPESPSATAPHTTISASPPTPSATASGGCLNVNDLPMRRQLGQLLMVSVDSSGAQQARSVVDQGVGGIFVGGQATGLLTSDALQQLNGNAPLRVMVAVDEEGGRVQRIDELSGSIPSARKMVQSGMTLEQVRQLARDKGTALRSYGVTVDFAPDADVSDQPDNAVIGDRSFSTDPQVVTHYAGAFADGLRDAGVLPVIKHFPGHGESSGDSHKGAVTVPPLDQLKQRDLLPFKGLVDESSAQRPLGVMVGHLDVPGLTEGNTPASLSPATLALLRHGGGYGAKPFDGVVFTDDLSGMAAITDKYTVPTAALNALQAGADVALFSATSGVSAVLDTLERAVNDGSLRRDQVQSSLRRVLQAKHVAVCD